MRLLLSQFKEVGGAPPAEVDRSLDSEDLDAEFARVARVLNGGLGPENLDPTLKFPTSMLSEAKSTVAIQASGLGYIVDNLGRWLLGVVGDASWVPSKLLISSYFLSAGTEYRDGAAFELHVGGVVAATFSADIGKAVTEITTFAPGPFAAGDVVYLQRTSTHPETTVPGAIATLSFSVPHTT